MRSTVRLAIAAMVGSLMLTSCASLRALNVDAVALPGSGDSDGYEIVIQFASVLNLPAHAKVVMDGTKVGVVTNVALTSSGVDVTSSIDHDVVVPSNIRSVLQQATVLGDTYVALERAPGTDPAAALGPGGRIPINQTTSPLQLEDTMANLANFIGSGSIQRAQSILININAITPPQPKIRQVASRAAADLADLSNNIDNVDLWLNGLAESANVMDASTPALKYWFSPEGLIAFHHNFFMTHEIAPLLPTIGTVYYNGYWLVPALSSIGDALEAIQHSKWAFDEEVRHWQHLLTDDFLPERKYPAINITSITGTDGRELSGNVQDILRKIGAMP